MDANLAIQLTKKAFNNRIGAELRYALNSMSSDEWRAALLRCSKESAVLTLKSKGRQLSNLCAKCWRTGCRYYKDGIAESLKNDAEYIKQTLKETPAKAAAALNEFRKMSPAQRTDAIIDILFAGTAFIAASGGADLEGGVPDADLILGIGFHRNAISHSIASGFLAETAIRFLIGSFELVHSKLPEPHHPVWDSALSFIRKRQDATTRAIWAGLCAHFAKDAAIFADGVKPYVGLPFETTMDGHQAIFAGNSALAGIFAVESDDAKEKDKK